ncbi:MAG: hypothetical protein AB1679_18900 [Actinomycetota bacterium]
MEPELTIGAAFTPRDWRASLQRHVRDHVAGVALRVIRDARMAVEEQIDVLVVDDEAPFLSPLLMSSLRERGIAVVGLYDPEDVDGAGEGILARLGVEVKLAVDAAPEELLAAVREATARDDDLDPRFEEVIAGLDLDDPTAVAAGGSGSVVAVGGPGGAGATEVAVALAQVWASTSRTILVDVDEVAPGVARRLQRALHPHLLTALDGLRGAAIAAPDGEEGDLLDASLARPLGSAPELPFDVLAGLADPRDWPLVGPDDIDAVLGLLARRWSTVVVNLGPHLEDLSRFVDRYGPSRAALARSDHLIGVCEATPRGVLRFLDWLVDAVALVGDRPVDVIVNRAPRGGFERAEVGDALQEHAGPRLASVTFAPDDKRVSKAAWDGRLVPHGRFLRAITEAAAHVGVSPAVPAVAR